MNPTVSVTICCYNGEKYLETTLQSVFTQTYTDWEIVIINDGSIDATKEIVNKYASEGYPITYHYQPNAGLGAARNKSVELAKGQFIAMLDQDDLWYPTKLEKQISLFENHPEMGVVYSDCDIIDENGQITSKNVMNGQFYEGDVFVSMLRDMVAPAWPTVVMRKSCVENVGGFVNYTCAEDLDILLKIAYISSFAAVKEVLASYRLHPNQSSKHYYKYLSEFISIYDYWANRSDFNYPNKRQYISSNLSKQRRLCAESAFDLSDDVHQVREHLYRSLLMSFSIKIFVLWCLSWLGLPKGRKLLKFIRLLISHYR